ncbi:MAG: hypothetical protein ACXVCY_16020 [Pseudobdellovibrionaceae bacterium]
MEQFQSSRISFPAEDSPLMADSPGRYPEPFNFMFETLLSWTPRGEVKPMSTACSAELWGARLMDARLKNTPQLQGALIQKYFQDCREDIETGKNGSFRNLMKMMTMKYSPQKHPFLRRVVLNLPGNVKLKGLLGLKGDFKRRPFVIVRLGIFSSVEDFKPERSWAMMFFEQSPFNVLLVENMSSADFISHNNQFSFGGYDEGIQNILMARLLTDSNEPLSRLVDSVHIFGLSLGGHGVLFSSLLNKYNSGKNQPLINSFTALCPVVNLQPTMEKLTHDGLKSAFVDLWSRRRLAGLNKKMPSLESFENFSFLSKAISEIARTYHGGLSYVSSVQLPPSMKDGSNFWELNDFWKYYKDVEQPVLIYATDEDPAVPFKINSRMLQTKELKVDSKNIRVINLSQGVHCTLPIAYDWHTLTTIFQSYILSHSPNFKMVERNLNVDLSDNEWKGFIDQGSKVTFEVQEPNKKSGFATVELKIENSKGSTKSMNLSLPLSQFDFRFLNSELSSSEQEMVVRWLNQNLKLTVSAEAGRASLKATWPVAL